MVTLVYLWIIGCSEPDLRSPLLRLERSNLRLEAVGYASWTSFDTGYTSGFDGPEKEMGDLPAGAGVKGGRLLS